MNVASRLTRQALLRSYRYGIRRTPPPTTFIRRRFSNEITPLSKPGQFNIIQRKGHGFVNYFREWEVLIFSSKDWRHVTFWVWGPSVFGCIIMFWCIWNSVMRDPEVRLRPHKKAWHISDQRMANGDKYRGGGFIWIPSVKRRMEYLRAIQNGEIDGPENEVFGYDEEPIPKLDDE